MRKKHILLITCISMSALLISCRVNNAAPTPSPVPIETAAPTSTPAPTPSVEPSPSAIPDTPAYEITEVTYAEGDITITYPQITGLEDAARQEQINVLIQIDATAIAEEGGSADIAYAVTWSGPGLLSIRYDGLRTMPDAAYPNNIFYTTNVDIANTAKVRLADVVNIDDAFIETFKAGEFIPWDTGYGEAEDLIRESVAGYDLAQALTHADNGYGLENPDYCFSYFTEDALGISIGVPHAIGDHAEFEIKYADIQDNMKTNDIWDDFSGSSVSAAAMGDLNAALFGDWVITSHVAGNRVSTYSQEAIDAMIGKELTCSESSISFDGDVLEEVHYQVTTELRSEHDPLNYVSFADLGIESASVTGVKIYKDKELQDNWLSPVRAIYIKDSNTLILIGEGEYFRATRQ